MNETLFSNPAHARKLMAGWVTDNTTARLHSAFGDQTSAGFALQLTSAIAPKDANDQ